MDTRTVCNVHTRLPLADAVVQATIAHTDCSQFENCRFQFIPKRCWWLRQLCFSSLNCGEHRVWIYCITCRQTKTKLLLIRFISIRLFTIPFVWVCSFEFFIYLFFFAFLDPMRCVHATVITVSMHSTYLLAEKWSKNRIFLVSIVNICICIEMSLSVESVWILCRPRYTYEHERRTSTIYDYGYDYDYDYMHDESQLAALERSLTHPHTQREWTA